MCMQSTLCVCVCVCVTVYVLYILYTVLIYIDIDCTEGVQVISHRSDKLNSRSSN